MPAIPEDIVRVSIRSTNDSEHEVVVNTFHMRLNKDVAIPWDWTTRLPEIASRIAQKVQDNALYAVMPNTWLMREVACYHLSATTGNALDKAAVLLNTGGAGFTGSMSGSLPFDVAAVVSLYTTTTNELLNNPRTGPSPAKRGRGRIYVGPLGSTSVNSSTGRFASAFITSLNVSWGAFFDDVHGMSWQEGGAGVTNAYGELVVLSRTGGTARVVKRVVIDDLPDTQRRRSNRQVATRTTRVLVQP